MSIVRWCAVALYLGSVVPAAAQDTQSRDDAIVVRGGLQEETSNWKRAEADHVVVISDGDEGELVRVTNNLERLYHLMSRLYRKGDVSDDTAKLQVTLFDSASFFRTMGLRNLHWEEGPYAASFAGQRYYDSREEGEVLAASRSDQLIKLNTQKAYDRYCEELMAEGAECTAVPYHPAAVRSWEAVLYSGFAQHFILTHTQAIYPRWYIDGIGALFSTISVRKDGSIDYARPPGDYKQVFRAYGRLNLGEVLTGKYLEPAPGKARAMDWTPYHAWLLTHFFTFSDPKPEWARQFRQYLTAIHRGTPMAEAAKVFGDMGRLQRELSAYIERPIRFARTTQPQPLAAEPLVTMLSPSSAAVIEAKLALRVRLAETGPADAVSADWLARIRDTVAQHPYDADALLVVAEAECRAGQPAECLDTAERVLARAPDNVRALAWKGVALTDLAVAGPASDRKDRLAAARSTIERAIKVDGQAPLPLIARFQSFTKAGERVPEAALVGMARAIQYVPAAPAPRLFLGEELVRQGNTRLARQILHPVLYGPDNSPEKRAAAALFSSPGGMP